MATSNSDLEVPTWVAGGVVSIVVAAVAYVFVYGGDAATPGLVVPGATSAGLGLFTLYLFHRFVVAVETIADKH
jgi:hypothetical protein